MSERPNSARVLGISVNILSTIKPMAGQSKEESKKKATNKKKYSGRTTVLFIKDRYH
jgi:hypothetical protein